MSDLKEAAGDSRRVLRSVPQSDLLIVLGKMQTEHRMSNSYLLAFHSEYVDTMLANDMAEKEAHRLTFPDIELVQWDLLMSLLEDKEAMETASKSLKIHKRNNLNYQIGKISAQYNLDAELGINCLQAYIENHSVKDGVPKDWAYYRLAQIYKNKGEKQTALKWIDKALSDRPNFKEAKKEKKIIESL